MHRPTRLSWAGHNLRMEDTRLPKIMLFGELAKLRYRDQLKFTLDEVGNVHESWEETAKDLTA